MNKGERLLRSVAMSTLLAVGACATNADKSEPTTTVALETTLNPTTTIEKNLPIDEADAAHREQLAAEWLNDVKTVVEKTKDPHAQEILNLLENAGLMTPHEIGAFQVLRAPKLPGAPFIAPLEKEDADKGSVADDMVNNLHAAAFYNPTINTLILIKPENYSPTFRAILALHEGDHAFEYTTAPYDWQDSRIFTAHEYSTHLFENKMLAEVGGPAYEAFISRYAEEINSKLVDKGTGVTYPTRGDYRPELDTIFGPAVSEDEKNVRQTHVWLDAAFKANTLRYGAGSQEADYHNLDLLLSLYSQFGVVQPNR